MPYTNLVLLHCYAPWEFVWMHMKRAYWRLHTLLLVTLVLFASPAFGDSPPDQYGSITLENITVTAGDALSSSTLRLRIVNESGMPMHLLGVTSPLTKNSRIIGRIDKSKTADLGSIGIREDGELDLTTSHMWIEIGPLSRRIRHGELIPIKLIFVSGSLPARAHVHDVDG